MNTQEMEVLRAAAYAYEHGDRTPQFNRNYETTIRQLAGWGLIDYMRTDQPQPENCFFVWLSLNRGTET